MTKRDYEALATVIRGRLETENRAAKLAAQEYGHDDRVSRDFRANAGGVQLLACDLIGHLRRDNPRFNAELFAKAAGLEHLIESHPEWTRKGVSA